MSEQPVSGAAAPPKKASGGSGLTKKVGPLPVWGWAVLGLGGAVAYLWWRSRKSGSSAGTTATTSTTSSSAYASQLDQMQAELDQLLAEQSASSAGTSGTGSGANGSTAGGGGGDTSSGTTPTGAQGTTTATKTTTAPTTKTTASTPRKPSAPHGVVADKVTATGATLHWDATGSVLSQSGETYRWRLEQGGKQIRTGVKTTGDLGIGSLKPKTKYDFSVAAVNSAGQSPWATVSFTTK
jgi:Fibronectin type III domain